jgi:hypothetical protein
MPPCGIDKATSASYQTNSTTSTTTNPGIHPKTASKVTWIPYYGFQLKARSPSYSHQKR